MRPGCDCWYWAIVSFQLRVSMTQRSNDPGLEGSFVGPVFPKVDTARRERMRRDDSPGLDWFMVALVGAGAR